MMSKTYRVQPEERPLKQPQQDWRADRDADLSAEYEPVEYPEPELDYVWKHE